MSASHDCSRLRSGPWTRGRRTPVVVLQGGPRRVPEVSWLEFRLVPGWSGRRHLPGATSTGGIAVTSLLDTRPLPEGAPVSGPRPAAGPTETRTTAAVSAPTPTPGSAAIGSGPGRDGPGRWFDRVSSDSTSQAPCRPSLSLDSGTHAARPLSRQTVEWSSAVREPDRDRVMGRGRSRDTNRRRTDHVLGR
jgi:hypothetical protein